MYDALSLMQNETLNEIFLQTSHDLREEVRLAADYFRAFVADDGDEISEMQRARHLEIVKVCFKGFYCRILGKAVYNSNRTEYKIAGRHLRQDTV